MNWRRLFHLLAQALRPIDTGALWKDRLEVVLGFLLLFSVGGGIEFSRRVDEISSWLPPGSGFVAGSFLLVLLFVRLAYRLQSQLEQDPSPFRVRTVFPTQGARLTRRGAGMMFERPSVLIEVTSTREVAGVRASIESLEFALGGRMTPQAGFLPVSLLWQVDKDGATEVAMRPGVKYVACVAHVPKKDMEGWRLGSPGGATYSDLLLNEWYVVRLVISGSNATETFNYAIARAERGYPPGPINMRVLTEPLRDSILEKSNPASPAANAIGR